MQLSSVLAHLFPSLRSSAPSPSTAPVAASAPSDFHVLLDQQSKLDQGLDYNSAFEVSSSAAVSRYSDESGTQAEVLMGVNDQHDEHAAALQHDLSMLSSDEQQQLLHLLNSFKESDPQLLQSMLNGKGLGADMLSSDTTSNQTSVQTDLQSLYNALTHISAGALSKESLDLASMADAQNVAAIQQLLAQLHTSQQLNRSVASLSADSASVSSNMELPIESVNGGYQMSSSADATTNASHVNSAHQGTEARSAQSLTTIRAALTSALEQAGVSAGVELIPTEGADAQAEMKLRFDSALNADQIATLLQQLSAMLHTPMQLVPSSSEGQSVAAGESGASASLASSQTSCMTVRFDSQALQNVAMQSLTSQNANSAAQEAGLTLEANANSQTSVATTSTVAEESHQVSDNSRASAAPSLHLDAASQPSATASLTPAEELLNRAAVNTSSTSTEQALLTKDEKATHAASQASGGLQASSLNQEQGTQDETSSSSNTAQGSTAQNLRDQSTAAKQSTVVSTNAQNLAIEQGSNRNDKSINAASIYTMKKLVEEMKSLGVEIENLSMEFSVDSRSSAKLASTEKLSSTNETSAAVSSSVAAMNESVDDSSIFASNMSYLFSAADVHTKEANLASSETVSSNSMKASAQNAELRSHIDEVQQDAARATLKNETSERLQRSQSLFASTENVSTSLFASTGASKEDQVSLFRSAEELNNEARALDQLQSGLFAKSEDSVNARSANSGEQQSTAVHLGKGNTMRESSIVDVQQVGEQSLSDATSSVSTSQVSSSANTVKAEDNASISVDPRSANLNSTISSEQSVVSTAEMMKNQSAGQQLKANSGFEQAVESTVTATSDIINELELKTRSANATVLPFDLSDQQPLTGSSVENEASDATASVGQKNQAESLNAHNAGTPSSADLHSAAALHEVKLQVDADLQALKHLEVKAQTIQRERAQDVAANKNEANTNNASASSMSAQTLASTVERNGEPATSVADAALGAQQDRLQQAELVNARTRQNAQTGLAAQRASIKNSSTHEQRERIDANGVESSATSPVPQSADDRTQRSESASLNGESRQEFGQQSSSQDASSSLFPSQGATVGQSAATQEANYASAQAAVQLHQASADSVVPSTSAMSPQQQRAFGMLPTEARTASKMQDQGSDHLPRVYRVPIQNFAPNASAIVKNLDMQKGGSAKLILSPEALGTVVVNLNLQESLHSINIEVASQSAKTAIEAQMPQLREQFVAQGVRIDTIAVQVRDNEKSQSFNSSTQQHSSQQKQEDREARASYLRSFEQRSDPDGRGRSESRSQRRSRDQQRRQQSRSFEQYA